MVQYGYTLFCEGFDPRDLVKQAVMAEESGFDFVVISDHYHPWLTSQEHAGFAWSILGAIAQATSKLKLATMVTCPIVRYHPAIVAQMAATVGVLSDGRFTLGLGTGELLNEHITGMRWPPISKRREMLREAVEIIRELWKGDFTSYNGEYFTVEDAKIFDLPSEPLKLFIAAGSEKSAELAAKIADGFCNTSPDKEILDAYTGGGGNRENIWGQTVLSWAETEKEGQKNAYEQFRFSATGGWPVQAELPNASNFDAAASSVKPEDLAEKTPCGPEPKKFVNSVKAFTTSGFNKVSILYPGNDTEGFMKFWQDEIKPQL